MSDIWIFFERETYVLYPCLVHLVLQERCLGVPLGRRCGASIDGRLTSCCTPFCIVIYHIYFQKE